MKIKEVENRVGMPRANIRYYEKEGLLSAPTRNENNYREYTDADVEQLQRIKILRLLGVTVADVKLLNEDAISMEEIMQKRLDELEKEVKEMQEVQKICETILEKNIQVSSLDESILTGDKATWRQRLEEIMQKDIVKEIITKKQLNAHIAGMLVWRYFINAVVSFFLGDSFMNRSQGGANVNDGLVSWVLSPTFLPFTFVAIAVICGIGIYWTASVKSQIIFFHISAFITTPLVIEASKIYDAVGENALRKISGTAMAIFWIWILVYVIVFYLISKSWEKMFTKVRYSLMVASVFLIIYTVLAYFLTQMFLVPVLAFVVMLFYIALVWTTTNMDQSQYNRYYAVVAACKIMNVAGTLFGQRGRGLSSAWLK